MKPVQKFCTGFIFCTFHAVVLFYHKILPGKLSDGKNPVKYAIIQYVPIKKVQPNTSLTLALKDAIAKMLKSFRHHLTKSIL